MEGYLDKKEGWSWVRYYYILHEDVLLQLDKEGGKPMGQIHMKVAKINPSPDKNDKLQMSIFNGTNEILFRTGTIKERVDWSNALATSQKHCIEGRYELYKTKGGSPGKAPGDVPRASVVGGEAYSPRGSVAHSVQEEDNNVSWHERLNMRFMSKVFSPDSPLFSKMGNIWDLEAKLTEVLSLLEPEAAKSGNKLIQNYAG
jgi:PH domain